MTDRLPAVIGGQQVTPADLLTGRPPARTPEELLTALTEAGAPAELVKRTRTWLGLKRSENTRNAYARDVSWWLRYAQLADVDPYEPENTDADDYLVALRATGKLAESTIARRLSTASSWYRYLVRAKLSTGNPFEGMERPKLDDESPTISLSAGDMGKLLAYAKAHEDSRTYTLFLFLATTGARISGALGVKKEDVHRYEGMDAVWITLKGGARKRFRLAPQTAAAIEEHAKESGVRQPDDYLFATSTGNPWDRAEVTRALWRVAKAAGIKGGDRLSLHSFRHSYATAAFIRQKSLADIQDAMGHKNPQTTRRYDAARGRLDRSPSGTVTDDFFAAMRIAEDIERAERGTQNEETA